MGIHPIPEEIKHERSQCSGSIRSIAKQKLYQKFDEDREKLLGQDKYFTEQITKVGDEKRFITGEELENLYRYFLVSNFSASRLIKESKTADEWILKPDYEFQEFLVDYIKRHSPGRKDQQLISKVKGDKGVVITSSADHACLKKDVEFASFCHPITRAILNKHLQALNQKHAGQISVRNTNGNRNGIGRIKGVLSESIPYHKFSYSCDSLNLWLYPDFPKALTR